MNWSLNCVYFRSMEKQMNWSLNCVYFRSMEKQMNWSLNCVYFRSSIKSSFALRKRENLFSFSQQIALRSQAFFFQYMKNFREAFQNQLKLRMATYRWNSRTDKVKNLGIIYVLLPHLNESPIMLSSKWNSLPLYLRDTSKFTAN